MEIRNITSTDRAVPTDDGDEILVPAGGVADVPDAIAVGRPPSGDDPTALGYDPGTSGLLAQTDVWEAVKGRKQPSAAGASTDAGDPGEEE